MLFYTNTSLRSSKHHSTSPQLRVSPTTLAAVLTAKQLAQGSR